MGVIQLSRDIFQAQPKLLSNRAQTFSETECDEQIEDRNKQKRPRVRTNGRQE